MRRSCRLMDFFSISQRRTGPRPRGKERSRLHLSRRMVAMLSGALLLLPFLLVLPARAATHTQSGHPVSLQAERNALKRQIRVTHTGHVPAVQSHTHVHATSAQPAYNNVGISDDQSPNTGNFDGLGDSYSAEVLQNLSIAPGLNVTTNTITYTWPSVSSGSADNYQAAGQVVTVAPISDAATVGFLG